MEVRVELSYITATSPFAILEAQQSTERLPSGESYTLFTFDLEEEEEQVDRFEDHVEVKVFVRAIERWPDPPQVLVGTHNREDPIPLPVIITHGILGDLAQFTEGTIGPGLAQLAMSFEVDGYDPVPTYPTLHQLVYPSLDTGGIGFLANQYMKRKVEDVLESTYAAKVDLVAHSMGGLLARFYIEELGGDAKVRKLVTIGTPHAGAAKSHDAIEHSAYEVPGSNALSLFFDWWPSRAEWVGDRIPVGDPGQFDVTTLIQWLPDYPYYTEIPLSPQSSRVQVGLQTPEWTCRKVDGTSC